MAQMPIDLIENTICGIADKLLKYKTMGGFFKRVFNPQFICFERDTRIYCNTHLS